MGRYAMRQNTLKTEGDRIGTAMIAFLFFSTARLWMERSAAGFAVTPAGDAVRFALTAASLAVPVLLLRNVPYTRERGISWSAHRVWFLLLGLSAFLCMFYSLSLVWSSLLEGRNWSGLPAGGFPQTKTMRILFLAERVVLPAVMEEILFRRMILGRMLPYGEGFAVLISAALFALAHGTVMQTVPVFCTGLYLGCLYLITGSLPACIGYHMINNGIAAWLSYLISVQRTDRYITAMYGILLTGAVSVLLLVFRYRGHLVRGLETEPIGEKRNELFRSLPLDAAAALLILRIITEAG